MICEVQWGHVFVVNAINWLYLSPEDIGNNDGSLMFSSITTFMHQFYINHCKR